LGAEVQGDGEEKKDGVFHKINRLLV
jgi:hypothetical protein